MNNLKYTLILASCLISNLALAQVGVKLGVHSFDLSTPQSIFFENESSIDFKSAELGFQGGLYGKLDLKKIFLETRVMVHSTEVSYTLDGDNGDLTSNLRNETFTNLNIPLLIGFDLLFLDVFGGPVAQLHLNSTSDLIDLNEYKSIYNTVEYGYRAGLGINLGKANVSLEYEGNFSNYGDHITIAGNKFDFGDKPSRVLVNIGFEIF